MADSDYRSTTSGRPLDPDPRTTHTARPIDVDARTTSTSTSSRPVDVDHRSSTTSTAHRGAETKGKNFLDWLSIILLIIGGLNWGLVGLLDLDIVATLFGQGSMISRVIYILVGLAAIWGFALMRLGRSAR